MGGLVPSSTFSTGGSTGWRPPQWNGSAPALTMTVKTQNSDGTTQTTAYVFDTEPRIEHDLDGVVTNNPVQTGASLNDHYYLLPMRVTAEILMSDSMQSFTVGQFASSGSRSVSAFQTLLGIAQQRITVSIATRLAISGTSSPYTQMMIVNIRAEETSETRHAGRFWVTFQQIILARVEQASTSVSYPTSDADTTRPQAALNSQSGNQSTSPVPPSIQQQNNIANAPASAGLSGLPTVSGAGTWSSLPVAAGGF